MPIVTFNTNDSGSTIKDNLNANFADLDTTKADLASPTFTGTPTAPTASLATDTTQVATTAFVLANRVATSTSGVSDGPASSSTQTITHGLGRTPTIIRLTSLGYTNQSGGHVGYSNGVWDGSGNRCIYIEAQNSLTQPVSSTSAAIHASYYNSGGQDGDGVVGNVTATTFDIVWDITGAINDNVKFIWEAQ